MLTIMNDSTSQLLVNLADYIIYNVLNVFHIILIITNLKSKMVNNKGKVSCL